MNAILAKMWGLVALVFAVVPFAIHGTNSWEFAYLCVGIGLIYAVLTIGEGE